MYIDKYEARVIALGPPCTGFGHWSRLSRDINPDTWHKSGKVGECLARFATHVCNVQLGGNRHLLAENLAGPELFNLACFEAICNICRCVTIKVPQRALGLIMDGQPVCGDTSLLANSSLLVAPFKGPKCTCTSHGALEGRCGNIATTKLAQFWPRETCLRICAGIRSLIKGTRENHLIHDVNACYPVDGMASGFRQRRGTPRKTPEGITSKERIIYDCLACMRRLHKRYPAHARNGEPPLLCKF